MKGQTPRGEGARGRGGWVLCVLVGRGDWLSWRIGQLPDASSGWSGFTGTGVTSAATTCTTRQAKRWFTSWPESAWFITPESTARNSSSGTTMILSGKGADFSGGGVGWGLKGREENVGLVHTPSLLLTAQLVPLVVKQLRFVTSSLLESWLSRYYLLLLLL